MDRRPCLQMGRKVCKIKDMKTLPPHPGTYVLMLSLSNSRRIAVGKLGTFHFSSGWYAYAGSAMGPGGLAARVGRHLQIRKKSHWHIDYLRASARLTDVFWAAGSIVKEHRWASRLGGMPLSGEPVKGFGCSDCRCDAHLYYYRQRPDPLLVAGHLSAQWNEMAAV